MSRALEPRKDLRIPEGLPDDVRAAAQCIVDFLYQHHLTYTGGCALFVTPTEWAERRFAVCQKAALVLVFEGSEAGRVLSFDYALTQRDYELNEKLGQALARLGWFVECGYSWCAGLYRCEPENPNVPSVAFAG